MSVRFPFTAPDIISHSLVKGSFESLFINQVWLCGPRPASSHLERERSASQSDAHAPLPHAAKSAESCLTLEG